MSDPLDDELTSDRVDAERLSFGWNAVVRGETGAIGMLQADDAAVIRRLGELAPVPRPRPGFVDHLRERLMDSTVSDLVRPTTIADPPLSVVPAVVEPAVAADRDRRWWGGLRLDVGVVATVALVIAVLMSGYFSLWSPESDGTNGAMVGTPPSMTVFTPDCTNYGIGCPSVNSKGNGFINLPDYEAADLAASQVQLQDWSLDPGARLEVPGHPQSVVRGAVVDFVIAGAFEVTVDGPAMISRAASPTFGDVEYLAPGTTAELSRGDAISYPAGRGRTVANPLSTIPALVKSVVIYAGDMTLVTGDGPQRSGVRIQVDGNGRLPGSLADYRTREVVVMLDYIQVIPGTQLPEERSWMQRIIGPVDPEQPDIEEGYVVWVGESRG